MGLSLLEQGLLFADSELSILNDKVEVIKLEG